MGKGAGRELEQRSKKSFWMPPKVLQCGGEERHGKARDRMPARMVMQSLIAEPEKKGKQEGPKSTKVVDNPSSTTLLAAGRLATGMWEKPNVFSDGSLKQNRCYFWQTGGAGVFWPQRTIEQVTEDEKKYTDYEQKEDGLYLWCPFNSLLNSSTRTELAAAIVAIIPPVHAHIWDR